MLSALSTLMDSFGLSLHMGARLDLLVASLGMRCKTYCEQSMPNVRSAGQEPSEMRQAELMMGKIKRRKEKK